MQAEMSYFGRQFSTFCLKYGIRSFSFVMIIWCESEREREREEEKRGQENKERMFVGSDTSVPIP